MTEFYCGANFHDNVFSAFLGGLQNSTFQKQIKKSGFQDVAGAQFCTFPYCC